MGPGLLCGQLLRFSFSRLCCLSTGEVIRPRTCSSQVDVYLSLTHPTSYFPLISSHFRINSSKST